MRQRYKGKVSEIKLNSVNERIKFNSISSIGSKELTVSYCIAGCLMAKMNFSIHL